MFLEQRAWLEARQHTGAYIPNQTNGVPTALLCTAGSISYMFRFTLFSFIFSLDRDHVQHKCWTRVSFIAHLDLQSLDMTLPLNTFHIRLTIKTTSTLLHFKFKIFCQVSTWHPHLDALWFILKTQALLLTVDGQRQRCLETLMRTCSLSDRAIEAMTCPFLTGHAQVM